ncbi:hypothetical protein HBB16_08295 [Pseudonocardia sp. MCCB 268]|nr:hypothetical protein [Pseudonocardia cytotoxica]
MLGLLQRRAADRRGAGVAGGAAPGLPSEVLLDIIFSSVSTTSAYEHTTGSCRRGTVRSWRNVTSLRRS